MIAMELPLKISTNAIYSGVHWATRKKHADAFHLALLPHRSKQFKIPAHLTFTFTFKGRLLDCTNTAYMAKLLEDGMVQCGILPGDTPDQVASVKLQVLKGSKDTVTILAGL